MAKRWMVMCAVSLACASGVATAQRGTDADRTFVGKVSQGGLYEVKASEVAQSRAQAQNVKDLAYSEIHDHMLVNTRLKAIASRTGIAVAPALNAEFSARLAKLKTVSSADFDQAYVADMKQIHDGDEKLFAQEATDGSQPFQAFAHETDVVVKQHIGALHGND